MAYWGIAAAYGPHINNPAVPPDRARAAWEALGKARAAGGGISGADQGLIDALASRYADPQPEDRAPLDQAYAAAMREAWKKNPNDADTGALFAEALMDLRPWDLWTPDGKPQPGTDEVVKVLEAVLALSPNHPLALHLYVHAMEMSPTPEKADDAADRLRDLTPGLGHLAHMPSHIDVRRGRWGQAMGANTRAMDSDNRYNQKVPRQGFYGLYMAHNHHMFAYAAMMIGQSAAAIESVDSMISRMPDEWKVEYAAIADGFSAMPLEVRMRFGRWDEILAAPEPPANFPLARAFRLYARGVAFAAQGKLEEARAEQKAFVEARAAVPSVAAFGNNIGAHLVDVAAEVLDGEILFRAGQREKGIAALRRGVEAEDRLRYDEPPDWILPVRHALGAALLEAGKGADAEKIFREDLKRLPDNGWSLFGLGRSLRLQGKTREAGEVEARFKEVWSGSDVTLKSSCFCQPGV
jgi:tetratricopeptide (TPR) repeat protein